MRKLPAGGKAESPFAAMRRAGVSACSAHTERTVSPARTSYNPKGFSSQSESLHIFATPSLSPYCMREGTKNDKGARPHSFVIFLRYYFNLKAKAFELPINIFSFAITETLFGPVLTVKTISTFSPPIYLYCPVFTSTDL